MIANLKFKSDGYYCSNCMMRQSGIPSHCYFCGYEFSNWEEIVCKKIIEEMKENESDICRKN